MAEERDSLRRQLRATDEQIEKFISRLDLFLQKNLRKILGDLEKGAPTAREAAQVLGGLQSALKGAGLDAELADIAKVYGVQLKHINDFYAKETGKGDVLADADYEVAEALITFDTSLVANKVSVLTDDLGSVLFTQIVTGASPKVGDLVEEFGTQTAANIRTEINTSAAGFSRTMTQKKAEDLGFDLFIYLGPDDSLTRDFCDERVNKIFTREQVNSWPDQQGLPANIYLGGYNCRHDLRPISAARAEELIRRGEAKRG